MMIVMHEYLRIIDMAYLGMMGFLNSVQARDDSRGGRYWGLQ